MAKVAPFHSPAEEVYHTCSNCTEGNNIEDDNRTSGTGNKRKCSRCAKLEEDGKC